MLHTGTADPLHIWAKFGDDMSQRSWVMLDKTDRQTDKRTNGRHHYENHFGGWFTYYLSIPVVKLRLYWKLRNFLNWQKFEVQAKFFIISVTGSMLYYPDTQGHSLHFELLIEVLAKKMRKLRQFQNLAYFLIWWPSFVTYLIVQVTCRNQWPNTYMDPIWWWFVKAFVNYAWKCANFV